MLLLYLIVCNGLYLHLSGIFTLSLEMHFAIGTVHSIIGFIHLCILIAYKGID